MSSVSLSRCRPVSCRRPCLPLRRPASPPPSAPEVPASPCLSSEPTTLCAPRVPGMLLSSAIFVCLFPSGLLFVSLPRQLTLPSRFFFVWKRSGLICISRPLVPRSFPTMARVRATFRSSGRPVPEAFLWQLVLLPQPTFLHLLDTAAIPLQLQTHLDWPLQRLCGRALPCPLHPAPARGAWGCPHPHPPALWPVSPCHSP